MYTMFPNKAHSLKNRLHNKNNITEKSYKRKQCGVPSFRAGMIITQPLRLRYGLGDVYMSRASPVSWVHVNIALVSYRYLVSEDDISMGEFCLIICLKSELCQNSFFSGKHKDCLILVMKIAEFKL